MQNKELSIAKELVTILLDQKGTVATVESCTGGLIAATITALPGSSEVFWGSCITYSNEAKTLLVDVEEELITIHGAVSQEVVHKMAQGMLQRSGSSLALAVSGIAGPGGGTPEKPVGTVWIGASTAKGQYREKIFVHDGDRSEVRNRAVREALFLGVEILSIDK